VIDTTEKQRRVSVLINNQQFFVENPVLGSTLRSLASIPDLNQLFIETPGPDPDVLVEGAATYDLKPGTHLYDLPRGTVGWQQ